MAENKSHDNGERDLGMVEAPRNSSWASYSARVEAARSAGSTRRVRPVGSPRSAPSARSVDWDGSTLNEEGEAGEIVMVNGLRVARRYRTMEAASMRLQKEAKGYLDSLRGSYSAFLSGTSR